MAKINISTVTLIATVIFRKLETSGVLKTPLTDEEIEAAVKAGFDEAFAPEAEEPTEDPETPEADPVETGEAATEETTTESEVEA